MSCISLDCSYVAIAIWDSCFIALYMVGHDSKHMSVASGCLPVRYVNDSQHKRKWSQANIHQGTTWASWSRDTCESLSGFHLVLGKTWASWSRDTCERLRGFYFVLGATLASPRGWKQIAFVVLRFGGGPLVARSTSGLFAFNVFNRGCSIWVSAIVV